MGFKIFDALSKGKPFLKLEVRFSHILRKKFASINIIGFVQFFYEIK